MIISGSCLGHAYYLQIILGKKLPEQIYLIASDVLELYPDSEAAAKYNNELK